MVKNTNNRSDFFKYLDNKKIGQLTLREFLSKLAFYLALVIIVPLLFPSGRSFKYTDLRVGSIINKKVIAPFNFPVLKTIEELAADRATALNSVPYFFHKEDSLSVAQAARLPGFIAYLKKLPKNYQFSPSTQTGAADSMSLEEIVSTLSLEYNVSLALNELADFTNLLRRVNSDSLQNVFRHELKLLQSSHFININKQGLKDRGIVLIEDGIEEEISMADLIDSTAWRAAVMAKFSNGKNANLNLRVIQEFALPNTIFRRDFNEQQQRAAINQVSMAKDYVYENERIVDANERITPAIYQKLYSLEVATAERSTNAGDFRGGLATLAKFLLTALILFIFIFYLPANRPAIFHDNKKLLLLTILIFMQVGLAAIIVSSLGWSSYLIPTTISSMLIGILFDAGVGFVGTVVIGLLLGGITGFDYTFISLTIIVGIVSIYAVTHIRTRNHIFRAILHILLAYTVTVLVFGFLHYEDFSELGRILLFYVLPNAILSPFITYMTLGIFERIFDITTDITLLELSDLNHPLLKELAVKAPGTFHHSIVVGNLAESAAKTIGGNSLLARVGSYYHDIGKMEKPEYFVENEQGGENKHESLAPNMSAIILSSHVKAGVEMAEENNLPKIIRDFIPQHHGRNVMSFFYNKAIQGHDEKDINLEDYRYPGPSPQSKETAIVMLADTVEAATKTLKNPSTGRLRKMVEELVEKRFLEGELDDSDLTMRDLKGIIDGFISVLSGIYHKRIEYPDNDEKKKNNVKKEQPVKQQANDNQN